MMTFRALHNIVTGILGGLACLAAAQAAPAAQRCGIGAWQLDNGAIIDIGASDEGRLRWRKLDGTTGLLSPSAGIWSSTYGWTKRPDGIAVRFGPCGSGEMWFGKERGRPLALTTRETVFSSHGIRLAGRLVLPEGVKPVAIVVLLHGAEHDSAREFNALQRILPALGVGAFVYDKRGTGQSGGEYTQAFPVLADDATAALAEARRLAGRRAARLGYLGPSQGGWVAPLAATRSKPDFVIVTFGLAVSVIEEDTEEVELEMRLAGHSDDEIAKAMEIVNAAHIVFESGFAEGIEPFIAVRERYRSEPWFADLHGNFTHFILGMSAAEIGANGATFRFGTPWRYDPRETIASVAAPQLWVLGGLDLEAPSAETERRLRALIDAHRRIWIARYPKAEHGMTEFEFAPDGERLSTRYASEYFQLLADFARDGRVTRSYGDARVVAPLSGPLHLLEGAGARERDRGRTARDTE
jgi:dienelactone hydrolase